MAMDDWAWQLEEEGIALLRDVFPKESLLRLGVAANRCFDAIHLAKLLPEECGFNRYSHSLPVTALAEFGGCDLGEIFEPLSAPGLDRLFAGALGGAWTCSREQSWVRKKFPPSQAPGPEYHPQDWHQDGALGVQFPLDAGPVIPMTELLTCWIPLNRCGIDSPGLEFIRRPQASLLHFSELNDRAVRARFGAEAFWVPGLELGDGLVFLNSVLHRTYAVAEMSQPRLSVEYRLFPLRVP